MSMRLYVSKRLIFYTIMTAVCMLVVNYNISQHKQTVITLGASEVISNGTKVSKRLSCMKYILQWTSPHTIPFVYMGVGQNVFIERNCSFKNCFVTSNRTLLRNITDYDAVLFHGPEIVRMNQKELPKNRSVHQKYVFACIESSDYYPVCFDWLDGYFNWTWTYKLNSDATWGYILVKDMENNIIGPKKDIQWLKPDEMKPITDELKNQLKSKTKAAAWFVSNCSPRSGREKFVKKLQEELLQYNLTVDIYGTCGHLKCGAYYEKECNLLVEKDYYFYLSMENSFSEDYVTEKLLTALQHNAVPIVFGAANYTRFMPDGIYLDGKQLGVANLASRMNKLIHDPEEYAILFKWKSHYSFHNRDEGTSSDFCRFCSILNDEKLTRTTTTYENFREWWNPPNRC